MEPRHQQTNRAGSAVAVLALLGAVVMAAVLYGAVGWPVASAALTAAFFGAALYFALALGAAILSGVGWLYRAVRR